MTTGPRESGSAGPGRETAERAAPGALLHAGAALLVALALAACGGAALEETPPPEPAAYPAEVTDERESTPERLLRNAARATYRVYVANESSDDVSRVGFVPGRGAEVEKTIPVGIMPGDIDGAHGIAVSPDGSRWYVSIAHGTPFGYVWQFATGTDTLVARTEVGRFPSTMSLTGDGGMLFAANFNLHGDPVPSDVSVVSTPTMTEIARVTTCVKPHGSRIDQSGTHQYSGCIGSEQLVQIDTRGFEVTKRFSVAPGREGALPLTDTGEDRVADSGDVGPDRFEVRPGLQRTCSPTWAEPATGTRADRIVYVACNKNDEVLVVSTERWEVVERYATGAGPYNLEATADGRYLLATLKGDQAVAVFDLDRGGEEVARIETSEPVTHGVVASPDSRYAFVSNEAVGSTRGTLDVIDLRTLERVATTRLGHQSGGIDFWEIARLGR